VAGNSADHGRSVASKVIAILMTFATGRALSMSEISRLAGLPMSTAHRLLTELAAWRILERTPDGNYRIGLPLLMIGGYTTPVPTLLHLAPAAMADLSCATGYDVRLGVLDDLEISYIEKPVGPHPIFSADVSLPAHATALGKAMLAFAPPRVVDLLIARGLKAYTPHTLTTAERLRRALALTRRTGIAVSQAELEPGASAIAAPVFGGANVVAALEIQIRDVRNEFSATKAALMVAARSLSRQITIDRPEAQSIGGNRTSAARQRLPIPSDYTDSYPRASLNATAPWQHLGPQTHPHVG
jgi:DNA-binding IclR family transcriptional regulator